MEFGGLVGGAPAARNRVALARRAATAYTDAMLQPPVEPSSIGPLDDRSREIFRHVVEAYLSSGLPLGSRNLARQLSIQLSPASIRNVMSDLEHLGLIYAPHVSAGRLPTQQGLRYFVDGFLEAGAPGEEDRASIEAQIARDGGETRGVDGVLTEASQLLSGLAHGAGVVIATKGDVRLKHIEFVRLDANRALVVLVGDNDEVENRILDLPPGMTTSALVEAGNWINAHLAGRTLAEARKVVGERLRAARRELDGLAQGLIDKGLAVWAGTGGDAAPQLIVHGRSRLLSGFQEGADLDRLAHLFDEMESSKGLAQLLELAEDGEGVRIFIGSENKLFSLSGSSVVIAPYRDGEQRVLGAVGVIGPTRLNYARIVPVVDYTAQVVGRMLRRTP